MVRQDSHQIQGIRSTDDRDLTAVGPVSLFPQLAHRRAGRKLFAAHSQHETATTNLTACLQSPIDS